MTLIPAWLSRLVESLHWRPRPGEAPDHALRLPRDPRPTQRVEERLEWTCRLPDGEGVCGRPLAPGKLCRRRDCMKTLQRLRAAALREDRRRKNARGGKVVRIDRRAS